MSQKQAITPGTSQSYSNSSSAESIVSYHIMSNCSNSSENNSGSSTRSVFDDPSNPGDLSVFTFLMSKFTLSGLSYLPEETLPALPHCSCKSNNIKSHTNKSHRYRPDHTSHNQCHSHCQQHSSQNFKCDGSLGKLCPKLCQNSLFGDDNSYSSLLRHTTSLDGYLIRSLEKGGLFLCHCISFLIFCHILCKVPF
jgi:hypothetical protein